MGDAENTFQPSKKRAAVKQLSRDNPGLDDDEETSEQETGTFKKASNEVLANRRIVKVRRHQTSSTPSAPSSNPFAGICLVPPTISSVTPAEVTTAAENKKPISEEVQENNCVNKDSEKGEDENGKEPESKVDEAESEPTKDKEKTETEKGKDENDKKSESKIADAGTASTAVEEKDSGMEATKPDLTDLKTKEGEKTENEPKKDTDGKRNDNEERKDGDDINVPKNGETASFSSFQQLSSTQNAFTGLAGSGFSSSTFSFGSISKEGSPLGSGSIFGQKNDQLSYPSFGFGGFHNGNTSLFGKPGTSTGNKSESSVIPSMQEVPVETGEENEKAVFTADSVLFEFLDGGWKERGKGELKVNVSTVGTGKARLVMRARGNYRLILNASLYSDMKLTDMEKKGITFACVNSNGEGKQGLSTFALKFKDASVVEEFRTTVTEHKGKADAGLKTPENSPKASDD